MSTYQSPHDLLLAKQLAASAPKEAQAFFHLKQTAERPDGGIPPKYRELISVAVSLVTQCPYCIDVHTRQARQAGASQQEVAEAVFIAAALAAGAVAGHGLLAIKLFGGASPETAPA